MVQHTQDVEAGRFLSWRLAWSTKPVLGQLRRHRETQASKYRGRRGKRERKEHKKEEEGIRAGEMAPAVKSAGPLLLKDPGLIPSTHLMTQQSVVPVPGHLTHLTHAVKPPHENSF